MCLTLENNLRRMPRVARSTCVGSSHELERESPGPAGQHRLGASGSAERPGEFADAGGATVRSIRPPGLRRHPARPDRPPDDRSDQQEAPRRGPPHRRGEAAAGRGGAPRLDHLELRATDAWPLEAGWIRARGEYEDPRHRARGVRGTPGSPAAAPARHLRRAEDLPGVGALLRPRSVHHAGHRRRGVHEHQHQADGRARAEADGRGEIHPGHVRRVHADVRDAGYPSQRPAADREREERAVLLLRQLPPLAHPGSHHAGPVDQDPEQPVRSSLLQLRAVSPR